MCLAAKKLKEKKILQVDFFLGKEMEMILTRTNEREIYFSEMILCAYFNLDFFIIK